jgi:hypothetical protein
MLQVQSCDHFEFRSGPAPPPILTASTPGSVEHMADEFTRRALQDLFDVPAGCTLGRGRDVAAGVGVYDSLRVECAWITSILAREMRPTAPELLQPEVSGWLRFFRYTSAVPLWQNGSDGN